MVNIASLQNKVINLTNDIYAQSSDHICIVETWLKPNINYNFEITGRTFDHVPVGKGKGCGIFSLQSEKLKGKSIAYSTFQRNLTFGISLIITKKICYFCIFDYIIVIKF